MKIAVIGAGIVGISSANWLKKYGQDVTLYDMNDPGSQASYGNAGTYAKYANKIGKLPRSIGLKNTLQKYLVCINFFHTIKIKKLMHLGQI